MKKLIAALALSGAAFAGVAHAADVGPVMEPKDWFVHVGAAGVFYDPGFNTPPARLAAFNPGLQLGNNITGVVEAGRYFSDQFSLSIAAGIPPTTDITLTGVPAAVANPGSVTFGSFILGGQFHFNTEGQIRPYLGAGVAYNVVFSTTPKAPNAVLNIDNGFGAVLQAGAEADVAKNVGVFVDVKKMFASANVTTSIGPSNAHFNPWIISAGVSFRF